MHFIYNLTIRENLSNTCHQTTDKCNEIRVENLKFDTIIIKSNE